MIFRAIRPPRSVHPGYEPSYARNRVLEEVDQENGRVDRLIPDLARPEDLSRTKNPLIFSDVYLPY